MATVTVPNGSLEAYAKQIGDADVRKVVTKKDILWNSLYLRETGTSVIEYYSKAGNVHHQYAYIPTGTAITAERLADLSQSDKDKLEANQEFKGWNTKKDGSGDMVTAETVVSEEMTVYPVIGEKAEEIHHCKSKWRRVPRWRNSCKSSRKSKYDSRRSYISGD